MLDPHDSTRDFCCEVCRLPMQTDADEGGPEPKPPFSVRCATCDDIIHPACANEAGECKACRDYDRNNALYTTMAPRLDEMLDGLKETARRKLWRALTESGAVADGSGLLDDNYLLPKAVLCVLFDAQPYDVREIVGQGEYASLKQFV